MRFDPKFAARTAMLTTACVGLLAVATVVAQEESVLVEPQPAPPVLQPAQPGQDSTAAPAQAPAPKVFDESMPAPTTVETIVHPAPPIKYHAGRRARRMLRCQEQVELVMVTKNPADCCLYEIPLCLPACCEGQPLMRERRGLFGRGVVEYCWSCGFTATVKFRLRGDVKVDYST